MSRAREVIGARKMRITGEDSIEPGERRAELDAVAAQRKLPNAVLVATAALLDNRQSAPNGPFHLEIAQHQHRVAEIADVQRCIHRPDQPMLREHKDSQHTLLAEIAQELV